MKAVADCDVLSTFAKIDCLDLLYELFSEILMPYAVYVELKAAERCGFYFPDRVYGRVELTTLEGVELRYFRDYIQEHKIHYGEAEGLAIA